MSWLRLDDGFTGNGKIVQLTDREFRAWMRLLCYCASVEDPTVDDHTIREVRGLFRRHVERFHALDLLDQVGENRSESGPLTSGNEAETGSITARKRNVVPAQKYEVHDWVKYLPKDTPTERQARWRARKAESDASTQTSTAASTNASTETSTHARAHAVPVQSLSQKPLTAADLDKGENPAAAETSATPRTNILNDLLDRLDIDPSLRFAAHQDEARACAWASKALTKQGILNPAGYFRTMLESGKWPAPDPVVAAPVPPCQSCGVGGGLHLADCETQQRKDAA